MICNLWQKRLLELRLMPTSFAAVYAVGNEKIKQLFYLCR